MILPLLLGPVALLLALRSARPTTPAPAGVKALWIWPAVALALFLYAFSPNVLAHTRFATQDLGLALFFVAPLLLGPHLAAEPVELAVERGQLVG